MFKAVKGAAGVAKGAAGTLKGAVGTARGFTSQLPIPGTGSASSSKHGTVSSGTSGTVSSGTGSRGVKGGRVSAKSVAYNDKEELLQVKLLPWGFADYVKIALFMVIKLPFILCVGILATMIEMQVKSVNTRSWHRPTTSTGPSCFVTELTQEILNYNTSINELAIRSGWGPLYNESDLVYENQSLLINYTITESDHCGLIVDKCEIDAKVIEEGDIVVDSGWLGMGHGGIDFGYFMPFALLWMLYKLVWIPLWPVDRIAQKITDGKSQPVFRLVTQPYFQVCTGFTQVLMMILNMLRYVFLPNYLLLPLTTLTPLKNCPEDRVLVHYEMDWIFGQAAYIWLVMDFISVVLAYSFFMFVYHGKVVGTWMYRLYKVYWLLTSITSISLFFFNLIFTFDVNFFAGLNLFLHFKVDFNVLFHYSIDMLAFMSGANFVMESLSMTYTIGGIILPYILSQIPCCSDVAKMLNPEQHKLTSRRGDEESRGLLGDDD